MFVVGNWKWRYMTLIITVILFTSAYIHFTREESKYKGASYVEVISQNASFDLEKRSTKIIYGATSVYGTWEERFNFSKCRYKNCEVHTDLTWKDIEKADVLLFGLEFIDKGYPELPWKLRANQVWILKAHESPAAGGGRFGFSEGLNGKFNATMTHRTDSLFYWPYMIPAKKPNPTLNTMINYAAGKTKGAFAYVSNCQSVNYDRLDLMKKLQKYIDVDIFGGCVSKSPCKRLDFECEDRLHAQYRFFFSFENSLCKDYITEKFWYRLNSTAFFIPVAVGGTNLDQYTNVAPPDSFLHLYNFTSIDKLGNYLRYLMEDDQAYNKYHQWRGQYNIEFAEKGSDVACKVCETANTKPNLPAAEHLDKWFNEGVCQDFNGT